MLRNQYPGRRPSDLIHDFVHSFRRRIPSASPDSVGVSALAPPASSGSSSSGKKKPKNPVLEGTSLFESLLKLSKKLASARSKDVGPSPAAASFHLYSILISVFASKAGTQNYVAEVAAGILRRKKKARLRKVRKGGRGSVMAVDHRAFLRTKKEGGRKKKKKKKRSLMSRVALERESQFLRAEQRARARVRLELSKLIASRGVLAVELGEHAIARMDANSLFHCRDIQPYYFVLAAKLCRSQDRCWIIEDGLRMHPENAILKKMQHSGRVLVYEGVKLTPAALEHYRLPICILNLLQSETLWKKDKEEGHEKVTGPRVRGEDRFSAIPDEIFIHEFSPYMNWQDLLHLSHVSLRWRNVVIRVFERLADADDLRLTYCDWARTRLVPWHQALMSMEPIMLFDRVLSHALQLAAFKTNLSLSNVSIPDDFAGVVLKECPSVDVYDLTPSRGSSSSLSLLQPPFHQQGAKPQAVAVLRAFPEYLRVVYRDFSNGVNSNSASYRFLSCFGPSWYLHTLRSRSSRYLRHATLDAFPIAAPIETLKTMPLFLRDHAGKRATAVVQHKKAERYVYIQPFDESKCGVSSYDMEAVAREARTTPLFCVDCQNATVRASGFSLADFDESVRISDLGHVRNHVREIFVEMLAVILGATEKALSYFSTKSEDIFRDLSQKKQR